MSSKNGTTTLEYLRSVWVEHKYIEDEYACLIEISIHPDAQRGVFCFHMEARGPIVDVGLLALLGSIRMTYPNAGTASLEGFLMNQMMKLGQMVAEKRGPGWRADPRP